MGWAIDKMIAMMEGEVGAREQRHLERMAGRVTETEKARTDIQAKMGSSYICNAIILFTTVTFLNYLYMLICNITTDYFSYGSYLPWVIFSMTCYILLSILLRRPRPTAMIVTVLAVFLTAQSIVCLRYYGYYLDMGFTLLALILFALTYFRIFFLVTKKVILKNLNNNFEIAVVFLVFGAIYSSSQNITYEYLYPLAAAAVLSLVAQVYERSFDGRKREKKIRVLQSITIVTSGIFITAVTIFAIILAMRVPIKDAVYTVLSWLKAAWNLIAYAFSRFGAWLMSVFPHSGGGTVYEYDPSPYEDIMGSANTPAVTGGDGGGTYFTVVFIIILIMLLAITAVFIIKHGRTRIGGYRGGGKSAKKGKKRVTLIVLLWRFFAKKISYAWNSIFRKNTVPGLFAWLQKRYRLRRRGRQEMETCRAFIRRIAREYPGEARRFQKLANALDSRYYGDGSVTMDKTDITVLRKAVAAKH
ncbi:MAG: hypothetical protein AB7C97_01600 [Oscillospiraceae bacterium]